MAQTLRLELLPETARNELLDFYDFLLAKYVVADGSHTSKRAGKRKAVAFPDEHDEACQALWVREAEERYDQIVAGSVTCRPLDEAISDAHKELL